MIFGGTGGRIGLETRNKLKDTVDALLGGGQRNRADSKTRQSVGSTASFISGNTRGYRSRLRFLSDEEVDIHGCVRELRVSPETALIAACGKQQSASVLS